MKEESAALRLSKGGKKIESSEWKVGMWGLALVFLLSACSRGEGIEAHEAWARSALQGENSAVYLILHNHTAEYDSLIGASSDVADAVELHLMEVENDVMRMTPVEKIEMPADSEIIFESGGYHIMLIGLKQDLNTGDEITVTLHFEDYPDVVLAVPVKESAEEHQAHP